MNRRTIAVLLGLALAAGIWITLDHNTVAPETATAPADTPPVQQQPAPNPQLQLSDNGRLTIARDALPEGDEVVFALPLAAGSIGDSALPARVVGVDGRVIDSVAVPAPEGQTGATLSLDPAWLTEGSYMIQLKTQEKSPLALKRYVLVIE